MSITVAVDELRDVGTSRSATLEVLAAVPGWWARRARMAGLPPDWEDWRRALCEPPMTFTEARSHPLSRASSHALGEAYVCALSPSERLRHGRHYTPKALADALWTEIERTRLRRANGPVVDPAGGAGALLVRPLRRFVAERGQEDPAATLAEAGRTFAGTDTDAIAAWLGSAVLAAELLPAWARIRESERRTLPALLVPGDGLQPASETAGVVVMNPPYGRAALSAEARRRWADSLYGHANWFALFLHAAVEQVRPGGVVAAVLPTSFLGGAYYQRLRRFLSERAPLVRLRLIDDRSGVFASGVLQQTCIAVFHKGGAPRPIACSTQAVNGRVHSVSLGRTMLAGAPDLPWALPRSRDDRPLVAAAARYPRRLRDYGWTARTGPLVWNRHKPRISAEPTADTAPILWASDLEIGRVRRSHARDGQRWIELRNRDRFMLLTEPAVLVQRTTAPEQARRLVAAPLTARSLRDDWGGAVVVENHVNVLRCDRADSPLTPEMLTALLNTPTFDRLYRCMTGTVAVSAYELEALPLPDADVLAQWLLLDANRRTVAVARAFA